MKIKLYQRVSLTRDVPERNLRKGDVAVVVEFLPATPAAFGEDGYALEAFNAMGETIAVIMVPSSAVKLLDEELMVNAIEGDYNAFEELVQRYQKKVWSHISRLLIGAVWNTQVEAEDLTQETFLKVYCKCHTYDESKGKFSSWLRCIATNTTIDFLRKSSESWWQSLLSLDKPIEDDQGEETARGELVPLPGLPLDEIALVRVCLGRLNPVERATLIMRHVEERTLQEIADVLGIVGSGRHVQATRLIESAEKKFRKLYEGGNEI